MPKAKDVTPGDAGRAAGGGVEPTRPPQDGLPQPLKKKGPTATSGWRGDKHSSRGAVDKTDPEREWALATTVEGRLLPMFSRSEVTTAAEAGSGRCQPRRRAKPGLDGRLGHTTALTSPGGSSELLLEGKGWSAQPLRSENLWNLPIFKKNPGHVVATPGNPT